MSNVHIRHATLADKDVVVGLMAAFYAHFDYHFELEHVRSALQSLLENESLGFVLVPIVEETIVGYAAVCHVVSLERGGRVAVLDELYVAASQQGSGVGSALLAAVEQASREANANAVVLEIEDTNSRAEELYRRNGYALLNRRVMEKDLSDKTIE